MTIADNVAYPLTVRNFSKAEREAKVLRALGMVQMDNLSARYPGQLSGGQQQRVALARALVFDPQLVLMDEPLGALDKQLREHMQLELKALHRQLGLSFGVVGHQQRDVIAGADAQRLQSEREMVGALVERTEAQALPVTNHGDSVGVLAGAAAQGCADGVRERVQGGSPVVVGDAGCADRHGPVDRTAPGANRRRWIVRRRPRRRAAAPPRNAPG